MQGDPYSSGRYILPIKWMAPEFTSDDELIIKFFSSSAAVATHNANIYENLAQHDRTISPAAMKILPLLNQISSSFGFFSRIGRSTRIKLWHSSCITFKVEAGEIFFLEKETQSLRLVLASVERLQRLFGLATSYRMGEGVVGCSGTAAWSRLFSNELGQDERFLRSAVVEDWISDSWSVFPFYSW